MSEDNHTNKFLKATIYFRDEVYVRTCDLRGVYSIFELICIITKIVQDVTCLNMIEHLRKMMILVRLPRLVKKSVCNSVINY